MPLVLLRSGKIQWHFVSKLAETLRFHRQAPSGSVYPAVKHALYHYGWSSNVDKWNLPPSNVGVYVGGCDMFACWGVWVGKFSPTASTSETNTLNDEKRTISTSKAPYVAWQGYTKIIMPYIGFIHLSGGLTCDWLCTCVCARFGKIIDFSSPTSANERMIIVLWYGEVVYMQYVSFIVAARTAVWRHRQVNGLILEWMKSIAYESNVRTVNPHTCCVYIFDRIHLAFTYIFVSRVPCLTRFYRYTTSSGADRSYVRLCHFLGLWFCPRSAWLGSSPRANGEKEWANTVQQYMRHDIIRPPPW